MNLEILYFQNSLANSFENGSSMNRGEAVFAVRFYGEIGSKASNNAPGERTRPSGTQVIGRKKQKDFCSYM